MAERITHNPHLEIMPDHAGPHYDVLRNTLTQNGMTVEQAVQALDKFLDPKSQRPNTKMGPAAYY